MDSSLPELYRRWIEALLGGPTPTERAATCQDCAMLSDRRESRHAETAVYFDPRVKCCTYVPSIPNYLVGRILLDRDPEMEMGRASVRARIATGVGVTPAGLTSSPTFATLYRHGASELFGRSVTLRCPHYLADTGGCGIWRHRYSVCATWFCKHERGVAGLQFWTSLLHLLRVVERSLSAHCVLQLRPGIEALRAVATGPPSGVSPRLTAADVDGVPDPRRLRRLWGRSAGREEEFYQEAARLVEPLAWSDVARLGAADVELAARLVCEEYEALQTDALPASLRFASVQMTAGARDYVVTSYRSYDPVRVPRALVDVLPLFDGRPTKAAVRAVESTGVRIPPATLRRLVDFGILVDASG